MANWQKCLSHAVSGGFCLDYSQMQKVGSLLTCFYLPDYSSEQIPLKKKERTCNMSKIRLKANISELRGHPQ